MGDTVALRRSTRTKLVGIVALLALVTQLASTFGHFHPEWVTGAIATDHADHADADHDHHHGKTPDGCAICTAVQLAQTFAPPLAPALPVQTWSTAAAYDDTSDTAAVDRHRGPFQSRAPPLA